MNNADIIKTPFLLLLAILGPLALVFILKTTVLKEEREITVKVTKFKRLCPMNKKCFLEIYVYPREHRERLTISDIPDMHVGYEVNLVETCIDRVKRRHRGPTCSYKYIEKT